MNPTPSENAHARITELQVRLDDINTLLVEVLGIGKWRDTATRTNLKIAIRAINAVRADMKSVCQDDLGGAETVGTKAHGDALLRAASEVASEEFDVQG
jgi:hypothetical protein